jgi:NAD-dependent deacetylase
MTIREGSGDRAGPGTWKLRMTDPGSDTPRGDGPALDDQLAPVAERLRASRSMVVFTGAGISTESGIPDYRGPNGVWKTNRIPTAQDVPADRTSREERWQWQRTRYPEMVARQPNAGHQAIAALERSGRVAAIVTQNIDGLHQKAGSSPERVLELHGSSHWARCARCGRRYPMAEIVARVEAGESDPRCEACGGPLRSSTILFGESLPEETLRRAVEASSEADMMLVVGSSLVVRPAAQLPVLARRNGAGLVIVNREPTPLDEIAHAVIRGEAGPVLSSLARSVLGADGTGLRNGEG